MHASELLFDDGDRVVAMGLLRRDGDVWWLESRRATNLAGGNRGGRDSDRSSRLIDADRQIAAFQAQNPAAAKLWLHVIGTWHAHTITVEAIAAGPGRPERPLRVPPDPPGPPPPRGWRTSPPHIHHLEFDLGDLKERGIIVAAHQVMYSGDRLVLLVAASDPAIVAAHLYPQLPGRVAIVACRYTRAQIEHVAATLRAHSQVWRLEAWGADATDQDGQPYAFAELFRVPRAMADWADRQPPQLLRLDPSVRPETSLHL